MFVIGPVFILGKYCEFKTGCSLNKRHSPAELQTSRTVVFKHSGNQNTSAKTDNSKREREPFDRKQFSVLGWNSHLRTAAFGLELLRPRMSMHESAIKTVIMAETTRDLVKLSAWQMWLSAAATLNNKA